MRFVRARLTGALALAVVALCACGSAQVGSTEAFREAAGVGIIDFEPFSPHRMASESSVIVFGEVASVEDGRVYNPGGVAMRNVVIGIEPIDLVKEDPVRRGELVYVELSRTSASSVDDIADSLPDGARVALFGWPADDPGFDVEGDPGAGREDDSSVYFPLAQGLWFETSDGLENVLTPSETRDGAWSDIDSWSDLKRLATT